MSDRMIPHEEQCPICGNITGCDKKDCTNGYWVVCKNRECQQKAKQKVVHLAPLSMNRNHALRCCGKYPFETPRCDAMTLDEEKVTCEGRPVSEKEPTRAELLARIAELEGRTLAQ